MLKKLKKLIFLTLSNNNFYYYKMINLGEILVIFTDFSNYVPHLISILTHSKIEHRNMT